MRVIAERFPIRLEGGRSIRLSYGARVGVVAWCSILDVVVGVETPIRTKDDGGCAMTDYFYDKSKTDR